MGPWSKGPLPLRDRVVCCVAAEAVQVRRLHASTSQLNVSTFCGLLASTSRLDDSTFGGRFWGVSYTQIELRSRRVLWR
jgi:hypothetical protein